MPHATVTLDADMKVEHLCDHGDGRHTWRLFDGPLAVNVCGHPEALLASTGRLQAAVLAHFTASKKPEGVLAKDLRPGMFLSWDGREWMVRGVERLITDAVLAQLQSRHDDRAWSSPEFHPDQVLHAEEPF